MECFVGAHGIVPVAECPDHRQIAPEVVFERGNGIGVALTAHRLGIGAEGYARRERAGLGEVRCQQCRCDWWLNSSSATLTAARRINNDSFYRVRVSAGGPSPSCSYSFVNGTGSDIKIKQGTDGNENTRKILGAGTTKSVTVDSGETWRVRRPSDAKQLWHEVIPGNCQNRTLT